MGEHSANDLAASLNDLPLLQDTSNEDVWGSWGATWRDVQVIDPAGELSDILNLTTNDIRQQDNYDNLRSMIVTAATANRVQASDWQNPVEPLDVNGDDSVAPIDALRIINKINSDGAGELTDAPAGESTNYYDVTGDNFVSSLDALRVIQVLNQFSGSGEPAGEPVEAEVPAAPASVATSSVDAFFALDQDDDDEEASELL